jgi:hypothetical protein
LLRVEGFVSPSFLLLLQKGQLFCLSIHLLSRKVFRSAKNLGWQAYLDGRGILREDEWQIGKGAVP